MQLCINDAYLSSLYQNKWFWMLLKYYYFYTDIYFTIILLLFFVLVLKMIYGYTVIIAKLYYWWDSRLCFTSKMYPITWRVLRQVRFIFRIYWRSQYYQMSNVVLCITAEVEFISIIGVFTNSKGLLLVWFIFLGWLVRFSKDSM